MVPPLVQSIYGQTCPRSPPLPAAAQAAHPAAAGASSAEDDDEGMYASEKAGEEIEPRGRAPSPGLSGEGHAVGGEGHAAEREDTSAGVG